MEAAGSEFYDFIREELPELIAEWAGSSNARIVIDPLTPVIWSIKERYHQREVLSSLFHQTKKIGTILCTLEEHGGLGESEDSAVFLPMYLADCVVRLSYIGLGFSISHVIKVIKKRGSWHSSVAHPYQIVQGMGMVVSPGKTDKNIHGVRKKDFEFLKKKVQALSAVDQKKFMKRARKAANSDLGPLKFEDVILHLMKEFNVEDQDK